MEGSANRPFVVHVYDPDRRQFETQVLDCISHEDAVANARALAQRGRVDLWLGSTKIGSFPPKFQNGNKPLPPTPTAQSDAAGRGEL